MKTSGVVVWRCVPLLVSSCCIILEIKDILAVRQDILEKRPLDRCMANAEEVIMGEMDGVRSVTDAKAIRSHYIGILKNNKGSVEDGDDVARVEDVECTHELL